MAGEIPPGSMAIGQVLKEARSRAGLEIGEVERRTKIRTRYLRALEAEEWDALPGEVYAKSFLRTYAQLLGLDAEALVDEFRRRTEDPRGVAHYPISEPMLRTRRRADQTGRDWVPGRGLVIGGLIVILLLVLLVLGLTGGEDGEQRPVPAAEKGPRREQATPEPERKREPEPPPKLSLSLEGTGPVPIQVCLLNGEGERLLDASLAPGERREFEAYRYQLRFPNGLDLNQVEVRAEDQTLGLGPDPSGAVAYTIETSGKISGPDPLQSAVCG